MSGHAQFVHLATILHRFQECRLLVSFQYSSCAACKTDVGAMWKFLFFALMHFIFLVHCVYTKMPGKHRLFTSR